MSATQTTTRIQPAPQPQPVAKLPRRKKRDGARINWGITALMAVSSLTVLVPLYFAVAMALKSAKQAASGSGFSWPWPMHFDNFRIAWDLTHFPRAFGYSALITGLSVIGELLLSSIAAYAIVRNWERRFFRWSYIYLLAAMFIPFPVIALPQVKLTGIFGLANPFGVAILHILFALSFNVLLYSAFLRSIPYELEESARMDGASTWKVFRSLILPLLGPMNATVGIFAFLLSWNDFMMPSLITANPAHQTLPVIQNLFQQQFATQYNVAFASYLMAMAPSLIGYLIAQRWVMSGVMRGAIK